MNNSVPENNEKLSKLLRESKADAPLPPRFQESVWRKIESESPARAKRVSEVFAHWIGAILPRPALATAYISVLLVIGITAGWALANQTNARVNDELSVRYVSLLDPYQTPHH